MKRSIFTGLVWVLIGSPLLLVVAMILLLVFPTKAAAPGVDINGVCRGIDYAILDIEISANTEYVMLHPAFDSQSVWIESDGLVQITYAPVDENPLWMQTPVEVFVSAVVDEISYDYWLSLDIPECQNENYVPAPPVHIPTNECIPQPYTIEGEGIFVVDDIPYTYNQNLSFIVPASAVWTWHVFIDDVEVLTLEQTADVPCHISATNP